MRLSTFFLALLLLLPSTTFAWGRVGHFIVAEIAERELSDKARKEIRAIVGEYPLANLANWADDIKSDKAYDHARAWHYINVPDGKDFLEIDRNASGDILTALSMFENQIADKNLPKEKRAEAIKFYLHFMGDLGQPMHLGRKEDKGGNEIKLKWFDKESNLHAIWDEEMVLYEQLSFTEYADYLLAMPINPDWSKGNYLDWARENLPFRNKIYAHQDKELKWGYYYEFKSVLHETLLKSGVRLAFKLNGLFGVDAKAADKRDAPKSRKKRRK